MKVPAGARVLDLRGRTVYPGLVGMHEHLFYTAATDGPWFIEQAKQFPPLYLAGGVTTARTTGSLEPYADMAIKRHIDEGRGPGPHLVLTAPYLEGAPGVAPQMNRLTTPEAARRMVDYWADEGFTTFKAYMSLTRDELAAAIDEVHKRKLSITGHLCAVTFTEAADLGIDDLEHGFIVDTDDVAGRKPDTCTMDNILVDVPPGDPRARAVIAKLVAKHVAVTSTLPVFEAIMRPGYQIEPRVLEVLSPESRAHAEASIRRFASLPIADKLHTMFTRELAYERAFVEAGGLLLAGCDPTGTGATVPGFCDQRELELLVEAGFEPAEAIHIGTQLRPGEAHRAVQGGRGAHVTRPV